MNRLFGILVTLMIYYVSRKIYSKYKWSFLNPILVSIVMLIGLLLVFQIDYEAYNKGGSWITYLLGPIVVFLALPLYKQIDKIKKNFIPIMGGVVAGIMTSVGSIIVLCQLFGLDETYVDALYAKSITTPLAIEVTKLTGGIESLTIVAVIITGVVGATIAPMVLKLGKVKHDVAKGIGIGTAAHGIGTAKAIEMGPEAAGASGLAMGLTGVLTVLLATLFL